MGLLQQQPAPRDYVAGGRWVFDVAEDSDDPVAVDLTFDLRATTRAGATVPEHASVQVSGTLDPFSPS